MNSDGTTETIKQLDQLDQLADDAAAGASAGSHHTPGVRPAVESRGANHFLLLVALVGLIAVLAYLLNELLA